MLATILLTGACGGGDGDGGRDADGSPPASGAPAVTAPGVPGAGAPGAGTPGAPGASGPSGAPGGSGGASPGAGGSPGAQRPSAPVPRESALRALEDCLRTRGIDLPPSGLEGMQKSSDPRLIAALLACREQLQG